MLSIFKENTMEQSFVAAYCSQHGWAARSFSTTMEAALYLLNGLLIVSGKDVLINEWIEQTKANDEIPADAAQMMNEYFHDWFWVAEG